MSGGERVRVVVADDNRDFCEILKEYLGSRKDIELVGVAHDGYKVLELLKSSPCDVLVLDIIMPHLDGIAVLEQLTSMDMPQPPHVVMLTAIGQEAMTQKVLELGASYYIMKPFDMDTLIRRIFDVMGQPAPAPTRKQNPASVSTIASTSTGLPSMVTEKNLEASITNLIHELGIPANIRGYVFLRDAIQMVIEEVGLMGNLSKTLYPRIADRYETTPNCVERGIRHAIEVAWNRGNVDLLNKLFGHTIDREKGKLTNSGFIAILADKLRMEIKAS
jgi:two-component system response regulator (stage 0 sporulation protein A)